VYPEIIELEDLDRQKVELELRQKEEATWGRTHQATSAEAGLRSRRRISYNTCYTTHSSRISSWSTMTDWGHAASRLGVYVSGGRDDDSFGDTSRARDNDSFGDTSSSSSDDDRF
jgi:hypothetical protein